MMGRMMMGTETRGVFGKQRVKPPSAIRAGWETRLQLEA